MSIDNIIKDVLVEKKFRPNKLMPLEGPNAKLTNTELYKKRGYTLKTGTSNIRKVYEKQTSGNIL